MDSPLLDSSLDREKAHKGFLVVSSESEEECIGEWLKVFSLGISANIGRPQTVGPESPRTFLGD